MIIRIDSVDALQGKSCKKRASARQGCCRAQQVFLGATGVRGSSNPDRVQTLFGVGIRGSSRDFASRLPPFVQDRSPLSSRGLLARLHRVQIWFGPAVYVSI